MSIVQGALGASKAALGTGAKAVMSNPGKVFAAGQFGMDANYHLKQGTGMGTAVFKAGVENILWATNPVLMGAAQIAPLAIQGTIAAHDFRKRRAQEIQQDKYNRGRVGGNYIDTAQAQTMRQAAVQQIQGNKLNARSALGGEARIFSNTYYS